MERDWNRWGDWVERPLSASLEIEFCGFNNLGCVWWAASRGAGWLFKFVKSVLGLSGIAVRMSFRSISIVTMSSCSFSAAHESSIWPCSVLAWSRLTAPHSKSIFTTSSCPFIDAQVRAVITMQSDPLTSHSFMSNRVETIPQIPRNATPWSPLNILRNRSGDCRPRCWSFLTIGENDKPHACTTL